MTITVLNTALHRNAGHPRYEQRLAAHRRCRRPRRGAVPRSERSQQGRDHLRGSNIYPREVDEVLLGHPLVSEAAVRGEPDSGWGEALPVPGRAAVLCDLNEIISIFAVVSQNQDLTP
jgi:hypothetical protein